MAEFLSQGGSVLNEETLVRADGHCVSYRANLVIKMFASKPPKQNSNKTSIVFRLVFVC